MKLIYHPFSPYSRKVYVLALELKIASQITLQKVVVAPVYFPGWSDNNLDVSAAGNPLAKIPVLVVDDFSGKRVSKWVLDGGQSVQQRRRRSLLQGWTIYTITYVVGRTVHLRTM